MSGSERYLKYFRSITILLSALLLTVILSKFYRNVVSPTDENVFVDTPTKFYLQKDIIGSDAAEEASKGIFNDTIKTGDLIIGINEFDKVSSDELEQAIDKLKPNDDITFSVINTTQKPTAIKKYFSKKKFLPDDFYTVLPNTLLILNVLKDGASDKAGVKPGDIVMSINGKTFDNVFEADKYLRSGEQGDIIHYKVLRNNQTLDLNITLVRFGASYQVIQIFLVSIIFFGFGCFIAIKRPKIKSARLVGWAFIFLGVYFSPFFDRFSYDYDTFSIINHLVTLFAITFAFPVLYHSTLYFPFEKPAKIGKRIYLYIPYSMGLAAFITGLVVHYWPKAYRFDLQLLNQLQLITLLCFALYKVITSIINRKTNTKEQRRITKPIWLSSLIIIAIVLIFNVTFVQLTAPLTLFGIRIGQFLFIGLIAIPLSYLYVIGRYSMLDMEIRVKRNIQYTAISVILKIVIMFSIVLSIWLFSQIKYTLPNLHLSGTNIVVLKQALRPDMHHIYENIILMIFSITSFILFWNLGNKIKELLDKKFYRTRFDYRRAATEFSDVLATKIGLNELVQSIVDQLSVLIHIKRFGIIVFKNEEKVAAQHFTGFHSKDFLEFCSVAGQKLVDSIREFNGEIRVDYLQEPLKDVFRSYKFRFIVPISSKRNILGAFLVGDKLSEAAFHREDIEFLSSLASQASVVIENAFLYEDLSQQERIKHELQLARKIQLASLPQSVPDIQGLDISGISLPALEVGGDFYDYLEDGADRLTVIVGDVSGKGTSAALYMSKIQGIMRTLNDFHLSPGELFVRSNELLGKYLEKGSFITSTAASFDTIEQQVTISRAGHLPVYYYSYADKEVRSITPKGILLGMSKGSVFENNIEEMSFRYNCGDVFLFVTDGLHEARNENGEDFGEERLLKIFRDSCDAPTNDIREKILRSIKSYVGTSEQYDDMTLVVVKVCPEKLERSLNQQ